MENLNNNAAPEMQETMPEEVPQEMAPEPKSGGMGPLIGVVIVVVLIALGGLYFWGGQLNKEEAVEEAPAAEIAAPSDEPAAIDTSLDEFDTDAFESDLDADLKALELEF